MSRRMIWLEDDHFAGWSCSQCRWTVAALLLDTTVAALAYNRTAQEGFEQHDCVASTQKVKARAQAAGRSN